MSRELGGSATEAFWTGTSFTLCSAGMTPTSNETNMHIDHTSRSSLSAIVLVIFGLVWPQAIDFGCDPVVPDRGHRGWSCE